MSLPLSRRARGKKDPEVEKVLASSICKSLSLSLSLSLSGATSPMRRQQLAILRCIGIARSKGCNSIYVELAIVRAEESAVRYEGREALSFLDGEHNATRGPEIGPRNLYDYVYVPIRHLYLCIVGVYHQSQRRLSRVTRARVGASVRRKGKRKRFVNGRMTFTIHYARPTRVLFTDKQKTQPRSRQRAVRSYVQLVK